MTVQQLSVYPYPDSLGDYDEIRKCSGIIRQVQAEHLSFALFNILKEKGQKNNQINI